MSGMFTIKTDPTLPLGMISIQQHGGEVAVIVNVECRSFCGHCGLQVVPNAGVKLPEGFSTKAFCPRCKRLLNESEIEKGEE